MTRRVLAMAATAAALCITSNAFADEAPATEPVEQPKVEVPSVSTPAPEPVAEPVAPAPEPVAEPVAPAPPPPAEPVAPAPPPPAFEMPRFISPLAMSVPPPADRPLASAGEKKPADETVRVGGMVGLGFPRPFAAEGFVKIKRVLGVGAEYSFMPNASIAGADIKFRGVAADLRVFPFKGGLFVGLRTGKQWLETRTTISASPIGQYRESMAASTWFVNPRIGYLKTWDNGITVGIDAGIQIPLSPSYTRDSDTARAGIKSDADKTLLAVADTLGNKMTPTIDLLRVGFLF